MQRIQILPDAVKKKIAAGEVVEGPFSVIKELVENSFDAGATHIDVEVLDSGLKRISVRDDGEGILRDDLPLAVMEHATNKIRDIGDIERIASFGFRGEALSSVAAISKMTIMSRVRQEEFGARIVCREGSVEMSDYAGPAGTGVVVENLFYNTPARKKFLKSRSAELAAMKNIFLRLALARPGVAMSFSSEGKRILTLPGVENAAQRISQIYGPAALENLYEEKLRDLKASIHAFLSKPDFLRSSRSMQLFYVNNRLVEFRHLGFLLSRAYEAVAPRGRHPAALIFLSIEPSLIDVNIHPAKREIKFFDQSYIGGMVEGLCRKVLGSRPHHIGGQIAAGVHPFFNEAASREGGHAHPGKSQGGGDIGLHSAEALPGISTQTVVGEGSALYAGAGGGGDPRIFGLIFDAYILFESNNALQLIDFHAAHERLLYDRLTSGRAGSETQALIFPVELELALEDREALKRHEGLLAEIGFDIDAFSEESVVVRGVPAIAGGSDPRGLLLDIIDSVQDAYGRPGGFRDAVHKKIACHAARRAGDLLSAEEMRAIVDAALSGAYELRCPHGRPYLYSITKNDLEKMFKRS